MVSRRDFTLGVLSTAVFPATGRAEEKSSDMDVWQREIDEVTPTDYLDYLERGNHSQFSALKRLDAAFERVMFEARREKVEESPAIWLVYNMGLLVKTRETFFSVDLCHRLAPTIAKELDFALITHNHNDHYTRAFYEAMDGRERKTVVNNFVSNYGARSNPYHDGAPSEFGGGFTRGGKTFRFKDVTIRTSVSDHNDYLVGFTMPFEIKMGKFTLYHTGDTANVHQLNPTCSPDLWIVHPRAGLSVAEGVRRFHPKVTVIAHLNEFTHPKSMYRWTWKDGLAEKRFVEQVGGMAIVPMWGARIA